jgi:hypothetical protein
MDELLVEAIRDNIQKYGYSLDPVDLLQNVKAALVAKGYKDKDWIVNFGRSVEDIATKHERSRIVGLFDAEEEQISEQDWTNNSMKRLDAHQRIIEGLRASPTEQTDGK